MWQCRSPIRSRCSISSRKPAGGCSLELAAVLAQLGLDVLHPEQRIHLRFGLAAMGLSGGVVEDPVLGDVQALADGGVAQRHVVLLGAGQVLEQVAVLVGRDDPQVDRQPRVGAQPHARVARGARRLDQIELRGRAGERAGVGGGGDQVEVLDAVGHPAGGSGERHPLRRRMCAQGRRSAARRSPAPG